METKTDTWLPCFSGFYGTIWEADGDEENEIDSINEERKKRDLDPITWDDVEWDYEGYRLNVVEGMVGYIGVELKKLGLIKAVKLQKLISPREYNFANDSIDVEITLTAKNVLAIAKYLEENKEAFAKHVKDRYTSCDGFISSYSNDATAWMGDYLGEALAGRHRLGSILEFILKHNEQSDSRWDDNSVEYSAYEHIRCNGAYLTAKNYLKLTEVPS